MNIRGIVTFLIGIGLVILVVILMVKAFTGGGDTKSPALQTTPLVNYAQTATQVQMIIDGPITADEEHNAVRVTVGRSETTIEMMQGYDGTVIDSKSFDNNQASYDEFLHALNLVGYTKTVSSDSAMAKVSEKGYCPTGNRYVFQIIDGSRDLQRTWATSCSNKLGTYKGVKTSTLALFKAQVPEYNKLVSELNL